MPYAAFPWFRNAPLDHGLDAKMPHYDAVRLPDLIDLAVESIRHPGTFSARLPLEPPLLALRLVERLQPARLRVRVAS